VKRYVAEPHSELVRDAMARADAWFTCRVGFVETQRAVGLAAGAQPAEVFADEWPAFGVVEVDQALVESAGALALKHELRSLDALHLAATLLIAGDDFVLATWDRRLHAAAGAEGLELLAQALD
jgi:uncharacterized protein